jgi:hypothetical protein
MHPFLAAGSESCGFADDDCGLSWTRLTANPMNIQHFKSTVFAVLCVLIGRNNFFFNATRANYAQRRCKQAAIRSHHRWLTWAAPSPRLASRLPGMPLQRRLLLQKHRLRYPQSSLQRVFRSRLQGGVPVAKKPVLREIALDFHPLFTLN